MDSSQKISFVLRAKVRGQEVTPETIPLSRFNRFNSEVERLILGSLRTTAAEELHATISKGSYVLDIDLPSEIYASLKPDIDRLAETGTPEGVDPKRVEILQRWEEEATISDEIAYLVRPAWGGRQPIRIDSSHRAFYSPRPQPIWVATEKYLNGIVTHAGGATQPNLHIKMEGYPRAFTVSATRDQLKGHSLSGLYEEHMLHVRGEERLDNGDLRNLQLVDFVDYQPEYDEAYLDSLIEKATKTWADIPDANAWLNDLRGYPNDG